MADFLRRTFISSDKQPRRLLTLQVAAFFFVLTPVLTAGLLSYVLISRQFDQLILARRPAVAYLAATDIETRLDALVDLGRSFASRPTVQENIKAGNWEQAAQYLRDIPEDYSHINRVVLLDPLGTAKADAPALPGVLGENFSDSDWYKGVSREWKPYVSTVYLRSSGPKLHIIGVASPVIDLEDGKVLGVLLIQVELDTFKEWAAKIEVGKGGYIYIVDQAGQVVSHPKYDLKDGIIDYSSESTVRETIAGRSGLTVTHNPIENEDQVIAYTSVPKYGWGVFVAQSTSAAFAEKYQELRFVLYAYVLAAMLATVFAFSISRFFRLYQEFREREKAFIESISEGVIATDAKGGLIFMNSAAERMLGWAKDEILGIIWSKDVPKAVLSDGKPIAPENRATAIAIETKRPVTQKVEYVRKDGTRLPVSVTASPILLNRAVSGSVAVFRDISDEQKLDRAKTEFVSLASHQLRTPMTSMKWYIDLLVSKDLGKLTAKQEDTLKDLMIINKNMIDLVSGLLNVARIELDTYAVEPQPVSLPEICDSVLSENLPLIAEKKQVIEKHYDRSLPTIHADASLVRVVFQNLITNAVKYTPEGGTIEVSLVWRVDHVEVIVTDTGYGIPKEQQPMIFSKMFRADNVRNKVLEGTGLGLYAAKAIVEQAGGKIWFESEEGKGTTFHVTIPTTGMRRKQGTTHLS